MPPVVVQLVSRLVAVSGLVEDTCENVIHVGHPNGVTALEAADLAQIFADFYTVQAAGASTALGTYIGDTVTRVADGCSVLAYATDDLTGDTPMGSPIAQVSFTMSANGSGVQLPEEVAAVCSYHGDLTDVPVSEVNPAPPPPTIRPAQRRRGRLFFGPLDPAAGAIDGANFRPTSGFRTNLGAALVDMAETINAMGDFFFGVWSKADATVYQAVGGYVDNAWDTQRRRGTKPTLRTSFVIA